MQWTYRAFDCKILSPIDCGANSNEVLCTRFGAHGFKRHAIEARHELVLRKLISICSMSDLRRGLPSVEMRGHLAAIWMALSSPGLPLPSTAKVSQKRDQSRVVKTFLNVIVHETV